jgi:hypothetical protein
MAILAMYITGRMPVPRPRVGAGLVPALPRLNSLHHGTYNGCPYVVARASRPWADMTRPLMDRARPAALLLDHH